MGAQWGAIGKLFFDKMFFIFKFLHVFVFFHVSKTKLKSLSRIHMLVMFHLWDIKRRQVDQHGEMSGG